jgi:hypothetical protein
MLMLHLVIYSHSHCFLEEGAKLMKSSTIINLKSQSWMVMSYDDTRWCHQSNVTHLTSVSNKRPSCIRIDNEVTLIILGSMLTSRDWQLSQSDHEWNSFQDPMIPYTCICSNLNPGFHRMLKLSYCWLLLLCTTNWFFFANEYVWREK